MRRTLNLAVLVICAFARVSSGQACHSFAADKSIDGSKAVFRLDPYPWTVATDLDANVSITNSVAKSTCKTKLEAVVSVYFGSGKLIYLRSADISSDQLFTIDGFTCKDAHRVRALSTKSESRTTRVLRSLGICRAARNVATGTTAHVP